MTLRINSHVRPRRAGQERSRNGCLTCKIRRVKCDETSPHCRKCTETGRKCEGPVVQRYRFIYNQTVVRSATSNPQLMISLLSSGHSDYERRAFDYFMQHMAGTFVPAVDARFWKELVPCLSQTYTFVWDILVCCSSLTEHGSYTSLTRSSGPTDHVKVINQEHRRALKYYDRAITSLQKVAKHEQVDESVIALSYMLFASVEFVQQNVKRGNDLVKRCCKVLTQSLTAPSSMACSAASQAIHQVVTPFAMRRAIVIATLGDASQPQGVAGENADNSSTTISASFPRLNEARIEFHSLAHDCYNLIRLADFLPYVKDNDPRKMLFMAERHSLLHRLMQWKASFTAPGSWTLNIETEWIRPYLLMYWAVCYVSLAACICPFETIFDDYMHHFAEIIQYGTDLLRYSGTSSTVQLLPDFDHGIVPPLYYCATKCRHPILRREALHLLRQAPNSESLWAFIAPDSVVEKVISAEEGELQRSFSSDFSKSQCLSLPPEECRYAYVSVVGRQAPGGIQRQALEMSRFEYGIGGSRKLISDYAWLDDMTEL